MKADNPLGLRPEDAARFQLQGDVTTTPLYCTCNAYDTRLDRQVLLKLPTDATWQAWSAPVRERLIREARMLARVQHDHVSRVYDVIDSPAGPVLVLELPAGDLLEQRLLQGPLAVAETRRIGIAIAQGLAALHYEGVVYRAIGPQSVRLTAEGKVKLADFSFAKDFDGRPGGSSLNYRRGADPKLDRMLPPYPAPEQQAGSKAEPRSDVFALGCLLFRCLTGQDPFAEGAAAGVLPDVRSLRQEVPPELAGVLLKCLAYSPAGRYHTAQALAEALAQCPDAVPAGESRRRWLAYAATVVVIAGAVVAWTMRQPAREEIVYAPTYTAKRALLIGIDLCDEPGFAALNNAESDVRNVDSRLRALGWQTELLTGPQAGSGRIRKMLDRLGAQARRDDALLVYFAGHGEVGPSGDFSVIAHRDAAGATRVPAQWFADTLGFECCNAKHVLVVFDCCHAGAGKRIFDDAPLDRGRAAGAAIAAGQSGKDAPLLVRGWRGVLTSATRLEQARDGNGPVSPFCAAFCAALDPDGPAEKPGGFITVTGLHQQIELASLSAGRGSSDGQQLPQIFGTGDGLLVFHLRRN